jgi:hypothetical protein
MFVENRGATLIRKGKPGAQVPHNVDLLGARSIQILVEGVECLYQTKPFQH